MKAIEKYVQAMENKDYNGLAELFDKDGTIIDYCPNGTSQREYHVYGKEAINMFFRNKFMFGKCSISEAEVVNDTQAEFVINYTGFYVMAIATVRRVSENGLIERLTVRPK
ncbi:MAG: hypothetical protein IKL73_06835 [Lachnospiraceae bacterium]|nr:hypothetical protein [Lachnospira sp.]MBQ8730303.1 hypothetical protein [Lachnospiraceae bacterium]MBR6697961.1 hypothetical protein [Lachnospiraceae bacterium]